MSYQLVQTNHTDDSITINETFIKMEPTDPDDMADNLTIDNTGDFLTVLVPENPMTSEDIKPSKCSKCSAIVNVKLLRLGPNENRILCQKCQHLNQSATLTAQTKKTMLNAISNGKNTLPFRCHYCSKMFDTKETFYNHIRVHAQKKRNPYLCGMCGKNFKELIQFKKHICARNVLKCNRCSKQFESIYRLENHYLVHSKYKCEECGKCLSSKTVLEEHKRVHTNEYPFKCEFCSRQFRQKSKYSGHVFVCKASNGGKRSETKTVSATVVNPMPNPNQLNPQSNTAIVLNQLPGQLDPKSNVAIVVRQMSNRMDPMSNTPIVVGQMPNELQK